MASYVCKRVEGPHVTPGITLNPSEGLWRLERESEANLTSCGHMPCQPPTWRFWTFRFDLIRENFFIAKAHLKQKHGCHRFTNIRIFTSLPKLYLYPYFSVVIRLYFIFSSPFLNLAIRLELRNIMMMKNYCKFLWTLCFRNNNYRYSVIIIEWFIYPLHW